MCPPGLEEEEVGRFKNVTWLYIPCRWLGRQCCQAWGDGPRERDARPGLPSSLQHQGSRWPVSSPLGTCTSSRDAQGPMCPVRSPSLGWPSLQARIIQAIWGCLDPPEDHAVAGDHAGLGVRDAAHFLGLPPGQRHAVAPVSRSRTNHTWRLFWAFCGKLAATE